MPRIAMISIRMADETWEQLEATAQCSRGDPIGSHSRTLKGDYGTLTAQLVLSYYPGAYRPTIRIDAQCWEDLAAVGRLFRRLASGETSEEDVGVALGCRQDSLHSLVAVRKEGRNQKALVLHEAVAGLPAFRWSQSGDDWLDDAERINRLLDSDSPGHQYLTHEVDDALVEVCFRE